MGPRKIITRRRLWPSALLLVGVALVTTPAAAEDPVAQVRAVEAAQWQALSGKSVEMASTGVLMDGRKRHEVATWRRIQLGPGVPSLSWVKGLFDGAPVDEEGLRDKLAGKKKKMGADVLLCVLEPFADADVSLIGRTPDGGARFYVVPHHNPMVLSVMVETDAQGRKRSATPRLGGEQFKLADKAEFVMRFAEDGSPLSFHSFTSGHFLWWSKSLEMDGKRVP